MTQYRENAVEQDLQQALGTLELLNKQFARDKRVSLMLDLIEARLSYALDPEQLVLTPKHPERARPPSR